MKLEEKIEKLDQLASQIEQNDVPLEKALEIFEQSVKIAAECMQTLNDCNGKLETIQEQVRKLTDEN